MRRAFLHAFSPGSAVLDDPGTGDAADPGNEAFATGMPARTGEAGTEASTACGTTKDRLSVLFVCTANVCRSPMAERIFNALVQDKRLPFRAESAGIAALRNEPIAPNAREALEEVGVRAGTHRARQLDGEMVERAHLVLVMGPHQLSQLARILGPLPPKVFTLPGYASGSDAEEVSDPYGYTMTSYRASVRQLLGSVSRVVRRLEERTG
jgi:protein-tyrosine phosphatase